MTDQAPELLPCPFCGNAAKIRCHDDDEATIMCANDACRLVVGVPATKRAIAIKNWNTRPTPAERPVTQVREALDAIGMFFRVLRGHSFMADGYSLDVTRADYEKARAGYDALLVAITARPSDAAVAKEEAAHLHTIDQRDEAEGCVRNVYFKIIGRSPEWSNNFGYAEALEEIEEAVFLLKAAAKPLALPPDEPARVNELRSQLVKAKAALKPFAEVAQADIGFDESDDDTFRPMAKYNNRAPLIKVGDMRRALAIISETDEASK